MPQENVEDINTGMTLEPSHKEIGLVHQFDHLFWFGDLNYRINLGNHGTPEEFKDVVDRVGSCWASCELANRSASGDEYGD